MKYTTDGSDPFECDRFEFIGSEMNWSDLTARLQNSDKLFFGIDVSWSEHRISVMDKDINLAKELPKYLFDDLKKS